MDTKIEDLRKQLFGNVNRLEAKLDDLQVESNEMHDKLSNTLKDKQMKQ